MLVKNKTIDRIARLTRGMRRSDTQDTLWNRLTSGYVKAFGRRSSDRAKRCLTRRESADDRTLRKSFLQAQVPAQRLEFLSLIAPFFDKDKLPRPLQHQGLSKGRTGERLSNIAQSSAVHREGIGEQYCSLFAIRNSDILGTMIAGGITSSLEAKAGSARCHFDFETATEHSLHG